MTWVRFHHLRAGIFRCLLWGKALRLRYMSVRVKEVLLEQIRQLVLDILLNLVHFQQDIDCLGVCLWLHHCNLIINMFHGIGLPLSNHLDTPTSDVPVVFKPVLQLIIRLIRLPHLMLLHNQSVHLLETLAWVSDCNRRW